MDLFVTCFHILGKKHQSGSIESRTKENMKTKLHTNWPIFVTVMFQHLKLNMDVLTPSLHTVCHSTAGLLRNHSTHWKSPKKEQKIAGTWPHLIGFFFLLLLLFLQNIFTCSPLNISKWAGSLILPARICGFRCDDRRKQRKEARGWENKNEEYMEHIEALIPNAAVILSPFSRATCSHHG